MVFFGKNPPKKKQGKNHGCVFFGTKLDLSSVFFSKSPDLQLLSDTYPKTGLTKPI